jgi:hypothetical protein
LDFGFWIGPRRACIQQTLLLFVLNRKRARPYSSRKHTLILRDRVP